MELLTEDIVVELCPSCFEGIVFGLNVGALVSLGGESTPEALFCNLGEGFVAVSLFYLCEF